MNKYLAVLFFSVFWLSSSACRFTVREIGFSILSQDMYTLAIIDKNANPEDAIWKSINKKNKDCNIRLEVLNPATDSEHPVVINAREQGVSFPTTILVAPDKRIFVFDRKDIKAIYSELMDSPVREKMRSSFPDIFAMVFWVKGTSSEKNRKVSQKIQTENEAIENVMPRMPKIVENGPVAFSVSSESLNHEKLLLWSLGIDSIPEEPLAFILYGRGRIMGDALNYRQIMDGGLYKYMSMIGADCECGLDRKWMLGHQIPLFWPAETRQKLAKLIAFDVDNPMILAEMSRILAKEKLSDASGSVAFAPESINLDEAFESSEKPEVIQPESTVAENKTVKMLWLTLAGLAVFIIAAGIILFFRKRK